MADDISPPGSGIARIDGAELIRIDVISETIDTLTEGRSKAQPELHILAFEVIQSIITGRRVEHLKRVFDGLTNETVLRVRAMQLIQRMSMPGLLDGVALPVPSADLIGPALKEALTGLVDRRFAAGPDSEFTWAVAEARSGTALPSIAAQLACASGAFDTCTDGAATTLEKARKAFDNSLRRI